MFVQQLYTGCLAEAAYYVESHREAVIIDPLRDIAPYLKLLEERKTTLKYIFETHFHADFVSGHLDLARATGATIVFGPKARPAYTAYVAMHKEMFHVGEARIKVLHTPGHTLESSCYLLIDEEGRDHAIFTGDTLFNGDVGRPDLAVKSDLTQEELAGYLYESIQRLKALDDNVLMYPAHGAGSQCGKNMRSETFSTMGEQKRYNIALHPWTREEFITLVTDGLEEPPAYFPENVRINQTGYEDIQKILHKNLSPLSLSDFMLAVEKGAVILDTRHPDTFGEGFIPGSLNVGLNGQYAVWVGTLLTIHQPLVLLTEAGKEEESVTRLARVGFENVLGYLKGGLNTWQKAGKTLETIETIHAVQIPSHLQQGYTLLDVRKKKEYEQGHVGGTLLIPLHQLAHKLSELEQEKKYIVHCAGGYRSMIAASIMKRHGFHHIKNIQGGFQSIKETLTVPLTSGEC